jgi:hypothetical protein
MTKARTVSLAGVLICFTLAATTANAQSFFDRGKDLLKGLDSTSSSSSDISTLTGGEISNGLREALRVGSERVVDTLGRTDGFNTASDIHIPLPGSLKTAQSMLAKIGMSNLADDLELRLNRAAEAAVPEAKRHFTSAIEQMTIDDAKMILNGSNDSATQYFRRKMSAPLAADMKPIVETQLASVGVLASYDKMMGQYKNIPFAPDVQANLTDYVLEKAIDGVFLYLGREEAAIRENPAKRTTELLQKVFGN